MKKRSIKLGKSLSRRKKSSRKSFSRKTKRSRKSFSRKTKRSRKYLYDGMDKSDIPSNFVSNRYII